jgi:hypothetical protein
MNPVPSDVNERIRVGKAATEIVAEFFEFLSKFDNQAAMYQTVELDALTAAALLVVVDKWNPGIPAPPSIYVSLGIFLERRKIGEKI